MSDAFDKLTEVVAKLRAPDGCPWDQKQTHESLKPYLLEETYEVLETIDQKNPTKLREELGDVLLQVLLHAEIETQEQRFTIQDVVQDLTTKLIRRHPHVFDRDHAHSDALNADQVVSQWEHIKRAERQKDNQPSSILESIPLALPALQRAYQMQKRATRVGFDWTEPQQVIDKLDEELNELREATIQTKTQSSKSQTANEPSQAVPSAEIEHELGDVLFTLANMARFLKLNPEDALRKATNRFAARFQYMETQAAAAGQDLHALTLDEWDHWWEEAKKQEKFSTQENSITP
ncbi:MAG: nucleoside triphosphate pyrophosphohydrolase [Nitrospirota bacterium]|nr:nucleoside triphosphate pyrophosphohydrolase [Nitrospirota bacterium]